MIRVNNYKATWGTYGNGPNNSEKSQALGRWPSNIIHDGSDEVVGLFPQSNAQKTRNDKTTSNNGGMFGLKARRGADYLGDSGSAARFFYCAKASRAEREAGCEVLPMRGGKARNRHPTVKPLSLMRYLCRLVTPPGGLVLDPFMGSGTTGCAALLEGFRFIGMDLDAESVEIASARIAHWGGMEDRNAPLFAAEEVHDGH